MTNQNQTLSLPKQTRNNPTGHATPNINQGNVAAHLTPILLLGIMLTAALPFIGAISHAAGLAKFAATQVYAVDSAYTGSHNLTQALKPVLGNQTYTGVTTTAKELPGNKYVLKLVTSTGLIMTYNSRTQQYDGQCTKISCWYGW